MLDTHSGAATQLGQHELPPAHEVLSIAARADGSFVIVGGSADHTGNSVACHVKLSNNGKSLVVLGKTQLQGALLDQIIDTNDGVVVPLVHKHAGNHDHILQTLSEADFNPANGCPLL